MNFACSSWKPPGGNWGMQVSRCEGVREATRRIQVNLPSKRHLPAATKRSCRNQPDLRLNDRNRARSPDTKDLTLRAGCTIRITARPKTEIG